MRVDQMVMSPPRRRWRLRSLAVITTAWLVLQIGGLFSPGLLDDVDSIYIEIAREMMLRHDYVTPYINGVRFFDKPPLMYWMAAGSMHIFGAHDWASRLPLALGVLALLLAVYALGIRLFEDISPIGSPDRGGFYAALAMATSVGPYLYTRFYIPDILLALWMTLGVHLFLIALDCVREERSALLPSLGFGAVMALNVLTKGLIGLVFPIGFVVFYLLITKQVARLRKMHLAASIAVFLAIAAPWHVLAAIRTPAIALPKGLGLPAYGGWAWFYLYNEHIARFLGKRIPHDYGQVPIPLFWLLSALWVMPWTAFLFPAVMAHIKDLRERAAAQRSRYEAALSLLLWAALVLVFFTLS
ncbi:MAG TPA: glycosyltransferase family 39 protein, partial [Edaphobacter sp.]